MNPISRLRTRARSDSGRSATGLLFSVYFPSVGESSSPRIESNVDLPQPDGPAIAMYSPVLISRWIPASACVSTSSVKNTFVTPSRWISVGADVFIVAPFFAASFRLPASSYPKNRSGLPGDPDPIERILRGHVRQNHLIARLQSLENLNLIDRRAAQLHVGAKRFAVARQLEQTNRGVLLTECRPFDIHD